MKIALISASTFPASLPDDLEAKQGYGSESSNAVLAQGLIEAGHEVDFFAPLGSSRIGNFHPIQNSKGQHLQSELLENCSLENPRLTTEMLLDFDFVIDASKSGENVEMLKLWGNFNKFACYRSGYQDFLKPWRLEPADRHLVTHCNYFKENFEKHGMPADVVHFGVHPFWCPPSAEPDKYVHWLSEVLPEFTDGYFLFPHRTSPQKGIDVLLKLAKYFPGETFVIATATPLPDHQKNMKEFQNLVTSARLSNVKFVTVPENHEYNFYRRELLRNAYAVLSPFSNEQGYMDTSGLISLEALSCGTPVIASRSPGSEEIIGMLEDNGVTLCDGYDSFRLAIKKFEKTTVKPLPWTVKNYVSEWETVIKKLT